MLWLKCELFKFEALRQKFDCIFELIKAEFAQRFLMTNLYMESSKKSVSLKENVHCIDGSIIQ